MVDSYMVDVADDLPALVVRLFVARCEEVPAKKHKHHVPMMTPSGTVSQGGTKNTCLFCTNKHFLADFACFYTANITLKTQILPRTKSVPLLSNLLAFL